MTERATDHWGFAPPSRRDHGADLVRLWREALDAAVHPPTCPCQGFPASYPAPDIVEGNILDFLRTQYRNAAQPDLVAFIERRRNKKPFAGLRQSFETWLQGIPQASLGPASQKLLIDDLQAVLRSYADARAGVFECV